MTEIFPLHLKARCVRIAGILLVYNFDSLTSFTVSYLPIVYRWTLLVFCHCNSIFDGKSCFQARYALSDATLSGSALFWVWVFDTVQDNLQSLVEI